MFFSLYIFTGKETHEMMQPHYKPTDSAYCRYLIVLLLFLGACHRDKGDFPDYSRNVQTMYGEIIDLECLIGQPMNLTMIDSMLFFFDRYEQKLITAIDIKNDRFAGRYASMGNGPEEFTPLLRLFGSSLSKELYSFEPNGGRMVKVLEPPDLPIKKKFALSIEGGIPQSVQKMGDYLVGMGTFQEGLFRIYDMKGNIILSAGECPFRWKEMAPSAAYRLYQGELCTNPTVNFFAIGGYFANYLRFYEYKDNQIILHKSYDIADAQGGDKDGNGQISDASPISYVCSYGTAKYCYMLYIGATYIETREKKMPRKIVVFDWEGNYIKSYDPDPYLFQFCVDDDDDYLYGLVYDAEGEFAIARFKL